ncbi:MAG: response regulator transcription factor [Candidatus Eisenbacteria bacterium]
MTAPETCIRVALVEDDPDIRAGLEAILSDDPSGVRCERSYESAVNALADLLAKEAGDAGLPDVVLMDIEMPGIDGIEATRRLRAAHPGIDVIMLTVRVDDDAVFRSLCAGAVGYLVKTTSPARLIDAVIEAVEGGSPLSPIIARRVTRSFQAVVPSPLTERETEILRHLCEGKSYKEIAADLFISERTVHSHLKNVYRKLEVHSKTEAMARAIKERWV